MKRELKKKVFLYSILITLLLVIGVFAFYYFNVEKDIYLERGCYYIWECGDITGDQAYICIRPDREFNVTRNNCIDIKRNNIIIDCLGLPINSPGILGNDSKNIGIFASGVSNVEIRDCILGNWNDSAIKLNNVENFTISGTTAHNSKNGLKIISSNQVLINNSFFFGNLLDGIYSYQLNNSQILQTIAEQNGQNGLNMEYPYNVDVSERSSFNQNFQGIRTSGFLIDNHISFFNIFVRQNDIGISLNSGFNRIFDSIIERNELGLDIKTGGNLFYNNIFSNVNNVNANDIATGNFWNVTKIKKTNIKGGLFYGGNYWGDMFGHGFSDQPPLTGCSDPNMNGVCEQPYLLIGNGNVDYSPLSPFEGDEGRCNEYITSCKGSSGWSQDMIYCLNKSVNTSEGNACFEINQDGITLDCRGFNISSFAIINPKGIKVNAKNVTLKNCGVYNINNSYSYTEGDSILPSSYGIFASSSSGLVISQIDIQDIKNSAPIKIVQSDNLILSHISIKNTTHSGIYLYDITNISLSYISIEDSNSSGVRISEVEKGEFSGVLANKNNIGFRSYNSRNNSFSNLLLEDNLANGLYIQGEGYNTWEDIEITRTGMNYSGESYGIYLLDVVGDRFTDVTSSYNNKSGFVIKGGSNLYFSNIYLENNNPLVPLEGAEELSNSIFNGLHFNNNAVEFLLSSNSRNNTFINSEFKNNLRGGLQFIGASGNYLFNSSLIDNNFSGIVLTGGSNDNVFQGIISSENLMGISIIASTRNNISDSNFTSNKLEGIKIEGIGLAGDDKNVFNNVRVFDNSIGLFITLSKSNIINNSFILNNAQQGIVLTKSSDSNTISNNYIKDNRNIGLLINTSAGEIKNNKIYNNYFKNTNNSAIIGPAVSSSTNYWNATKSGSILNIIGISGFGGNYWNDYSIGCNNTNGDFFCDESYNLSNNNKDYLPIAQYQTATSCTEINSCGQSFSSFNCYNLNTSLVLNSGSCFNISGQNITLDCQNNVIDGNNSASMGINISGTNINSGIKIKRCKINNFADVGVKIDIIGGVIVESSELNNNKIGFIVNSDNNFISSSILNSKQDAIQISGNSNTLSSVSVSGTNSSYHDLVLGTTSNTNIIGNGISRVYVTSDRLKISRPNEGEIKFYDPISGTIVFGSDIQFLPNQFLINNTHPGIIDKQASITLFGVNAGISRVLLRDGSVCNSTTNPSCVLNSDITGTSVSFNTSKTGDFNVKGYSLILTSSPGSRVTSNYTLFSFNLSFTPGTDVINCTLLINNNTETIFNNSQVNDNEEVNYRFNISDRSIRYDWNLSCINTVNQILSSAGWFNASDSSVNSGSGNNNGGNTNPSPGPNSTCIWIPGGHVCASGETCNGTFTSAADTDRCCIGNCVGSSGGSTGGDSNSDSGDEDCDFACSVGKFFENKTNLIITLVVIGIVILLILIIFIYSFKNKGDVDKIRIFQDQSRGQQGGYGSSLGLSQYSPIQPRPVSSSLPAVQRPVQKPVLSSVSSKPKSSEEGNAMAINAARLSLRNYILKETKKGVSEPDLREALSRANWKESEINSAFSDVKKFLSK